MPAGVATGPSCAELVGNLAAVTGGEVRELEPRGLGLVATIAIGADVYRVQLDPLPAGYERRLESRRV